MTEPRFRFAVTHEIDPTHEVIALDVSGVVNRDRVRYGLWHGFPRWSGYEVRCWQYDANRNLHLLSETI